MTAVTWARRIPGWGAQLLVQYAQLAVRAAEGAGFDVRIRQGDAGLVVSDRVRAARDHRAVVRMDHGGLGTAGRAFLLNDESRCRSIAPTRREGRRCDGTPPRLGRTGAPRRRLFRAGQRLPYGVALEAQVDANGLTLGDAFFEEREDRPQSRCVRRQLGHGWQRPRTR
jgi:hypothetical protein